MKILTLAAALLALLPISKIIEKSKVAEIQNLAAVPPDSLRAEQFLQAAIQLNRQANFQAATQKADSAITIYKQQLPQSEEKLAHALYLKGSFLTSYGEFEAALPALSESLDLRQRRLPADDLNLAETRLQLANLLRQMGKRADASTILQSVEQAIEGKNDPKSAQIRAEIHFQNAVLRLGSPESTQLLEQSFQEFQNLNRPELAARSLAVRGFSAANVEGNYALAEQSARRALDLSRPVLGSMHPIMATAFSVLGNTLTETGNLLQGLAYSDTAFQIGELFLSPKHPSRWNATMNLGNQHLFAGRNKLAVFYYQKSLDFATQARAANANITDILANLGLAETNLGNYDDAARHEKQALDLRNAASDHPERIATASNNLGKALLLRNDPNKNDLDSSIFYFKNAFENWKETDYPSFAQINLGAAFRLQKNFSSSKNFLQLALGNLQKIFPNGKNPLIAKTHQELADLATAQNNFPEAEKNLHAALGALNFDGKNVETASDANDLFHLLARLGNLKKMQFLQEKPEKLPLLEAAAQWHDLAEKALERLRLQLSVEEAGASFLMEKQTFFETALETVTLLAERDPTRKTLWLEKIWHLAETSKGIQLLAAVREAQQFAGVPDEIVRRDRQLRHDLADLEASSANALNEGASPDDTKILTAAVQIGEARLALQNFRRDLRQKFPEFFKLVSLETNPLSETATQLIENQTVVSYFLGNKNLFVLVLNPKNGLRFQKIPLDFNLPAAVQNLREGIFGYYTARQKTDQLREDCLEKYLQNARLLHQKLIEPIQSWLPEGGQIVIVPDGVLGNLPFEALLTRQPGLDEPFSEMPYFFKKNMLSYAPSATIWQAMRTKKHLRPAGSEVLALAPWFFGESGDCSGLQGADPHFSTMPCSCREVEAVLEIFKKNGKYEVGTDASKAFFIENAQNFRVIHLALHGLAGNRNAPGSLFFTQKSASGTPLPDPLRLPEIYALALNADLVTLSACETGIGEVLPGEGVLSLARAFAFAGARSILTTSWKVDGNASRQILVNFYKNQPLGKAKSLHRAREIWLHENRGTDRAHPFFWAGHFLVGDAD